MPGPAHIEPVLSASPSDGAIALGARLLRAGRLVAFPTETVYGLGANALDPSAIDRIYAAKGRPAYNPLIVHLATRDGALAVVADWPERAEMLARAFWPGPLTLVLPKKTIVPDGVTAGLPTVAVRVPAHPIAHALLVAAGIPIAAPSANRSTEVSPTTAAHVAKSLGDRVDLILDGGPTSVGIESTVLDVTTPTPTLLRPGMIAVPELEAVIGSIAFASSSSGEAARPSPGMLDKHSSPRAELRLVDGSDVGIRVEHERANSRRVGAIVIEAPVEPSPTIMRLPNDAAGYAARLYETLHALDDAGCDVIIVERVPGDPRWVGVADRLRRAATASA
jgi:L-threonylcarbamoyladenylate synthase